MQFLHMKTRLVMLQITNKRLSETQVSYNYMLGGRI
jgi:hypothetical protein